MDRHCNRDLVARRAFLRLSGAAAVSALAANAAPALAADERVNAITAQAGRGMRTPKIVDIIPIEIPLGMFGSPLTLVKVVTDQAGLYGYGEATLSRGKLVRSAVVDYLKPLLVGRDVDRIEDIWQTAYLSSYYKNDHAQNCAISGVTDALWDIKGRMAAMPVYQLVGGKLRDAAEVYMHTYARGLDPAATVDHARRLLAQGVRNLQVDVFGSDAPGKTPTGVEAYDRDVPMRKLVAVFEAMRGELGGEVKFGTDLHSMFDTNRSVALMKHLAPLGPWYWIEDPLAPEEQDYLAVLRQKTDLPIALGELYNNPAEWRPVIASRQIDYLRIHISHIGGFTVARRVAAQAEAFQVRTGWHGSPDISPVGHMARLTLDLTTPNFGFHEHFPISEQMAEIFPGAKEVRNGYAFASDKPGWGVEVDEKLIAKLPDRGPELPFESRQPDGSAGIGVG